MRGWITPFLALGREKREEKEEKPGKKGERASGGTRSIGPKISNFLPISCLLLFKSPDHFFITVGGCVQVKGTQKKDRARRKRLFRILFFDFKIFSSGKLPTFPHSSRISIACWWVFWRENGSAWRGNGTAVTGCQAR
jgi:hypothetical protein